VKRRLLFNVAAVCSLGLCLASLALWCCGWYGQDLVFRGQLNPTRTRYRLIAARHAAGRLIVVKSTAEAAPDEIPPNHPWVGATRRGWTHQKIPPDNPFPDTFHFALLQWRTENMNPGMTYVVGVRLLPLAAVSAVLPLVWLRREIRRRLQHAAGHCQTCGYDLRASPERCPECGAPAAIFR